MLEMFMENLWLIVVFGYPGHFDAEETCYFSRTLFKKQQNEFVVIESGSSLKLSRHVVGGSAYSC